MGNNLDELEKSLRKGKSGANDCVYYVPSLWTPEPNAAVKKIEVNPFNYYVDKIEEIRKLSKNPVMLPDRDWTKHATIYNIFARFTTCFDHNGDGKIETGPDENGFRETGTFLKSIAILPYLKSMGVNVVYLLPITEIGLDGRKGDLGSPYAIKNPYKIDENLGEPVLNMNLDSQFAAFVEAAHSLGMKVVLEFVLRTASIDSDLALERPEWFYWIKENVKDRKPGERDESKYGAPVFKREELEKIKQKVESGEFLGLPKPSEKYRNMFVEPPSKTARVENRIYGVLGELKKTFCRIPGAFADWPPDDVQPPWSDVTYLRLYAHPDFNYIAYNTVRMYDEKLAREENAVRTLWDELCGVIPYYKQKFGIDGVLLDMGHALPSKLRQMIVSEARKGNPGFVFWEENFALTEKSAKEGYDASVGYLPFDLHRPNKAKEIIEMLAEKGSPIPFFGTPETHNTPRAASRYNDAKFSKLAWAFANFLPTIPFISSGFELGEEKPINTGLDFTDEEIKKYPQDVLPLFSTASLNWVSDSEFKDFIWRIAELRNEIMDFSRNYDIDSVEAAETTVEEVVAYKRVFNGKKCLFVGSINPRKKIYFGVKTDETKSKFNNYFGDDYRLAFGWMIAELSPFEFMFGELL